MKIFTTKATAVLSSLLLICLLTNSCKKEQGPAGSESLVNLVTLPAGDECPNGGVRIETGVDINNNNILDGSEVTASQSVCNGIAGSDGYTSLTRVSDFSSNEICEAGGLQIQTGLDSNFNGVLDDGEVQQTQQVCNGVDGGYDKQVAILLTPAWGGLGTQETAPYVYKTPIVYFNIDNFTGIDSAVFYVGGVSVVDAGNTVNFKLYNITDNSPIENSLVSTNSQQPVDLVSENILSSLPGKTIKLGVQAYVNKAGQFGNGTYFYLILYRK